MPNYLPPKPRDRNNGQDDNYYDLDQHVCVVLYDERQDGYICGYCCDDFTHSQLHATYGGDILPMRIRRSNKTLKHLRDEECLLCGMSVGRSFD